MKKQNHFIFFIALLFLSACLTAPTEKYATPINEHAYEAQGRISIRYPNCPEYRNCHEELLTGRFLWQVTKNNEQLTLYAPTGQEILRLNYQTPWIEIEEAQQKKRIHIQDLETQLGFPLPIDTIKTLILEQNPPSINDWQVHTQNWQGNHYQRLDLRQNAYHLRLIIQNIENK